MQRTLGKYHIIAELGSGGMSDVFLAVARGPAGFNKLVVVKVLRGTLVKQDAVFVDMFLDEARLAAHLNHANVVQTNEVGQDGDHYFIAMEYLEGQSLHHLSRRARKGHGRVPLPMFLHIVSQALEGLNAAHTAKNYDGTSMNIVHRDASPHNIFVTYDGHVKVVDFGIAKANGRVAEATQLGVLKGKLAFMPPEQAHGHDVDLRTDLFAMGVILFDYLADRRMWAGCAEVEILSRLLRHEYPRSPRDFVPDVPEELDAIVRRALSPDPAERYPNARAMQAEIDAYLTELRQHPTQREIGEYVSGLFQHERLNMSNAVERQLRLLREDPGAQSMTIQMPLPDLRGAATTLTPSALVARSLPEVRGPAGEALRPPDVDPPKANRGGVGAWFVGGLMLAGLVFVIAVVSVRAQRSQTPSVGVVAQSEGLPPPQSVDLPANVAGSAPSLSRGLTAQPPADVSASPVPTAPPVATVAAPPPQPRWSPSAPQRPVAKPPPVTAAAPPVSAHPIPTEAPGPPAVATPRTTRPDLGY